MTISRSARALAAVLKARGPVAEAIRSKIHRSQLWHYVKGTRAPGIESATLMHELSAGAVPLDGWTSARAPKAA